MDKKETRPSTPPVMYKAIGFIFEYSLNDCVEVVVMVSNGRFGLAGIGPTTLVVCARVVPRKAEAKLIPPPPKGRTVPLPVRYVRRSGYCQTCPSVVEVYLYPDVGKGVPDWSWIRKRLRTTSNRASQ